MPRTPGYATRQRSLVLECLKAHAGQYLSVADIAADLTKKGSPVGVTTIYRALEKLASEGTVRRFVPDRTSPAVFEYLENPAQAEFHVRCKGCGKLFTCTAAKLPGWLRRFPRICPASTVWRLTCRTR